MTSIMTLIRALFDALSEATADAQPTHGVYAKTRSRDGVYAVTNTQSAESTYAAAEAYVDEPASATAPDPAPVDCTDPQTCPTCDPPARPA